MQIYVVIVKVLETCSVNNYHFEGSNGFGEKITYSGLSRLIQKLFLYLQSINPGYLFYKLLKTTGK